MIIKSVLTPDITLCLGTIPSIVVIPANGENYHRKMLSAIHRLSTGRHCRQDSAGATDNEIHKPPLGLHLFAQYMLYAIKLGSVYFGKLVLLVAFEILIR